MTSPSYELSFRSYHVNKQTNKQILLKTSTSLRYATPEEGSCLPKTGSIGVDVSIQYRHVTDRDARTDRDTGLYS